MSEPTIKNCIFEYNSAKADYNINGCGCNAHGIGNAIMVSSYRHVIDDGPWDPTTIVPDPVIANNIIRYNGDDTLAIGREQHGAIALVGCGSGTLVKDNEIHHNEAGFYPAVWSNWIKGSFISNLIYDNDTDTQDLGSNYISPSVYISVASGGSFECVNNILFEDFESGSYAVAGFEVVGNFEYFKFVNNTVARCENDCGLKVDMDNGTSYTGDLDIYNNIFWCDSTYQIIIYNNGANTDVDVHYNCMEDGVSGIDFEYGYYSAGNFVTSDPDFEDAANGDYHLDDENSPCVDAGYDSDDPQYPPITPERDFDNEVRPNWATPPSVPPPDKLMDIGADEYSVWLNGEPN